MMYEELESREPVGLDYMKDRLIRTTIKSIWLIILLVGVSFVNKTWLTLPLIQIGQITKVWISATDIFGIYIAIQFVEAFVDIAHYGMVHAGKNYWRGKREKAYLERVEALKFDDEQEVQGEFEETEK